MHQTKSDLKKMKNIFVLGQIAVLLAGLVVLFVVMILGYREKVLHVLLSKLDASTETMANQLKANQVPLASTGEHGVFIINQSDGTMVIDRHNDTEADKELWSSYRTKLIYEMQKQKRGWIVYPDKEWWNWQQEQRIIRYIPIDSLGWILATEASRPTELKLLREAVTPSVFMIFLSLAIFGSFVLWFMTDRYFSVIKRHISQSLENNLMSLGGEEKVWEHIPTDAPTHQDDLQKEATGLSFQSESQLPMQKPVKDRKAEDPSPQQRQREMPLPQASQPMREIDHAPLVEEPGKTQQEGSGLDQLTVNVNSINSPVLKKILQQFRNK